MDRPSHRQKIHPGAQRSRLGRWAITTSEKIDAELYALHQAVKIFDVRGEQGQEYTILSDSAAAIDRSRSDERGSGQRFAVATVEVYSSSPKVMGRLYPV